MTQINGLVGFKSHHLGGGKNVSWMIEVDTGLRKAPTGKMVEVKANGGDMYVCSG